MRRLPSEPVPRLAPASRWLARSAVAVTLLSIVATRFGGIPHHNGLLLLALGIFLAFVAVIAATGALAAIWRTGAPGAGTAIRGLLLALLLLAWPGYLAVSAARLPLQNDVTTDTADPPSFSRSRAALDARRGYVPPEFDRQRITESEGEAAGDLPTITVEQPPEDVMLLVQRAATNLGWLVIDTVNPAGRTGTGRVDAIARSLIFRFPDDITIRIRPGVGETRIDLRSASRIGRHDLGANTRHIRDFRRELDAVANPR
jgi:Protein of unknown function (DUF1499)